MFNLHTIFSPFFNTILHFCLGNPNCNQASIPPGLLARLTTPRKNEHGSLIIICFHYKKLTLYWQAMCNLNVVSASSKWSKCHKWQTQCNLIQFQLRVCCQNSTTMKIFFCQVLSCLKYMAKRSKFTYLNLRRIQQIILTAKQKHCQSQRFQINRKSIGLYLQTRKEICFCLFKKNDIQNMQSLPASSKNANHNHSSYCHKNVKYFRNVYCVV